jgi:hypothetical protein
MGDVRNYRSIPTLLVIIGSLALLALLAMLQYRCKRAAKNVEK